MIVSMTLKPVLNIGIIGAGGIVLQRHLPGLRNIPGVEITAVCNSTFESSRKFCETHLPQATPVKNWADIVGNPEIDIVWIGTQPYMHAPISLSAIEANKHVFCQARMAMDLAEAEEMAAAAAKKPELVTMLCPAPHGMLGEKFIFPNYLQKYELRDQGYYFRLQSTNSGLLDPSLPAHWRQKRELSGLHVQTLGIYIEVLQHWFGPITSVSARSRIVIPERQGYVVSIPDILFVHCEFQSGMIGTMEFSGVTAGDPQNTLEVFGDHMRFAYDFNTDQFEFDVKGETTGIQSIPEDQQSPWQVEQDFIQAIRSPSATRPRPGFQEGLEYMRVVQAVADSLESGQQVNIGVR